MPAKLTGPYFKFIRSLQPGRAKRYSLPMKRSGLYRYARWLGLTISTSKDWKGGDLIVRLVGRVHHPVPKGL